MKEKYLIFSLSNKLYATPMNEIISVLDVGDMVRSNLEDLKITAYNNRTLAVIDPTYRLTNMQETRLTTHTRILVVELRNVRIGILVEKILGVEEFYTNEFVEPDVFEKRYIRFIHKQHKIVDLSHFINEQTIAWTKKIKDINVSLILSSDEKFQNVSTEREKLVETLKLECLNFLIESNRRSVDDQFIKGMMNIYNKIGSM